MVLPEFIVRCRAGVRRLAGRHRSHAHHHVGPMVKRVVHQVHHIPTIVGPACRWIPIAAVAGLGAASPVGIVSLSNVIPSPASVAGPGPAPVGTVGTGPVIVPGNAVGGAYLVAGNVLPRGIQVMSLQATSGQSLLPVDNAPLELILNTLPVSNGTPGNAPGPALPPTIEAFSPPPDRPGIFLPQPPLPPVQPTAAFPVPEPSTVLLLAGVAFALLLRRRKKGPQPWHDRSGDKT